MALPPLRASTRAALRACLESIERQDRSRAVHLARELARDPERPTRSIAVRLLYLLRLYQEALDAVEEDLRNRPDDPYAHRLRYSLLTRLHFEEESHAALGRLLRIADDVRVHEAAVLHYQSMGRAADALAHLEPVLRAKSDAHRYREQLRLAVAARDPDVTRRAAAAALEADPSRWLDVVDRLLDAGFFDLAERAARPHADGAAGRAVLAQLALYRGAWDEAYARASSAYERDPGCERALTVVVGASVLGGDLDRAGRDLAAWSGARGPTLQTWSAELSLRRGDLAEARRALTRVQNEVSDYLAAKLLFVLVNCDPEREPWATMTAYDGLLEGQLQSLGVEVRDEGGRVEANELRRAAAEGLARLGGNRSPFPSVVRDGALQALGVPASPRHRTREAQHLARWLGLERAREAVNAELTRIGPHPIAECYEAELDLWSGDYGRAREKFERILRSAPRTTWAWIGLGASETLLGDAARGLQTLDEGVRTMGWRGATLPVYRGEALFRVGRLDEAAGEMREACDIQPGRVGAWLLRLLIAHARGDDAERAAAFAHLDRTATALLSDAARVAGMDGWWPGTAAVETQVRIAEQALNLMRGNRSSSCAFWIAPPHAALRSVVHQRPVTTPAWETVERRNLLAL